MRIWHIITGEYPPQGGGVSDYTWLVATGLAAAGDKVHVWAPRCGLLTDSSGAVEVHRLSGHFGPRALMAVSRAVRAEPACSLLVQYVPHAYGFKAMNVPLCLWLNFIHPAELIVMFHEVAFPMSRDQPLQHNLLGVVTTLMARLVSRAATRIIVASERWQSMLNRLCATTPISWLPVPSTIPLVDNAAATAQWRTRCTKTGGLLMGHFANYSDYSVERLSQIVPGLLSGARGLSLLLLGANSNELRRHLLQRNHHLEGSIHASGRLARQDLSSALSACDVMVQPYPDGVSTRRSSTSALMAHGRAVVTTEGIATEPLWMNDDAVAMAPAGDANRLRQVTAQMLSSAELRDRYAQGALKLYDRRFALHHTIAALIGDSPIRSEWPASAYGGSVAGSSSVSSLR